MIQAGLPLGFSITVADTTEQLDDCTLLGGSPARVLRLSDAGRVAWTELLAGPVATPAGAVLARKLIDAGIAHPVPPRQPESLELTVVIPVLDRPDMLDECLQALGRRYPVLVVDDGSAEPTVISAIAARHGANLVRHNVNRGPAAARNTGIACTVTEFLAFLDSDCIPNDGWIEILGTHFADPLVAAVAPRIVAAPGGSAYGAVRGALDQGTRPANVVPLTAVAYLPTAALLVRRAALLETGEFPFDPALRYGEDVDLCWRLHAAGWRLRYVPTVTVGHNEPTTWFERLVRRFKYGTSAGPLALRHAGLLAPVVLQRGALLGVLGVLFGRRWLAAAGLAASVTTSVGGSRRAGLPASRAPQFSATTIGRTWLESGRYLGQFGLPMLAVLSRFPSPKLRFSARSRFLIGVTVLAPGVRSWLVKRPAMSLPGYVIAHLADDIAYGGGVLTGSVRSRTFAPLLPMLVPTRSGTWRTRLCGPAPKLD